MFSINAEQLFAAEHQLDCLKIIFALHEISNAIFKTQKKIHEVIKGFRLKSFELSKDA